MWLESLKRAIQGSDGWGKNFSYLPHYPRFWRVIFELFRRTTRVRWSSDGRLRQVIYYCSEV